MRSPLLRVYIHIEREIERERGGEKERESERERYLRVNPEQCLLERGATLLGVIAALFALLLSSPVLVLFKRSAHSAGPVFVIAGYVMRSL